ncbi:MAG: hypothetical protein ACW98K_09945, partial [Candidatus Kariarchaeaceae archaeon]
MQERGSLICWNCGKRTNPTTCIHCGVEILSAVEAFKEEEVEVKRHILEIRKRGKKIVQLDLDILSGIVSSHFVVKQSLLGASPEYLVSHPGSDLHVQFESLIASSQDLLQGLTPKIQRVRGRSTDLIIKYIYIEPSKTFEFRRNFIFMGFTFFSIFAAGLFNYSKYILAQNKEIENPIFGNISISLSALLSAGLFALVLMSILLIKDLIQIKAAVTKTNVKLSPYFLPAPPIFELGTLGSFLHQRNIHKDKNSLFFTAVYGPIVGWILSIAIILLTLPLAIEDPQAAEVYSKHSIVAEGSFEPLGFTLISYAAKWLNIWEGNTSSPLTTTYLLHPLTIAGMAGFYICGMNLLPASYLNGGFLVRAKFGRRAHTLFTYLVIILLITVQWLVALLILFLNDRLGSPEILNEESELTGKSTFWISVALLI